MHPEYPCAHCIESASLAGGVQAVFGTAEMPDVSMTSPTAPGVTHNWTNIRAFVDEVSQARIWAGFHYRFSTKVGQDMGYKIGEIRREELHAARLNGDALNEVHRAALCEHGKLC